MKWNYDENCSECKKLKSPCCKEHTPSFGHSNCNLDTDPSRQLQPIKRSSSFSTASASASTLSSW